MSKGSRLLEADMFNQTEKSSGLNQPFLSEVMVDFLENATSKQLQAEAEKMIKFYQIFYLPG